MSFLRHLSEFFLGVVITLVPASVLASGGIDQFSSPLEKVVNTITGPAGKWIAVIGMCTCGLVYMQNKEDISGGVKLLLNVVFAICFIAFATQIIDAVFTFSGAVI